jgi:hypothetical protein
VDGFELAALDALQHGLAGHAESAGRLEHRQPGGVSSTKRSRSSSVMRMRQGAPGVSCSPAMNPSASQRCTVEVTTPKILAASVTVTSSPSGCSAGG